MLFNNISTKRRNTWSKLKIYLSNKRNFNPKRLKKNDVSFKYFCYSTVATIVVFKHFFLLDILSQLFWILLLQIWTLVLYLVIRVTHKIEEFLVSVIKYYIAKHFFQKNLNDIFFIINWKQLCNKCTFCPPFL